MDKTEVLVELEASDPGAKTFKQLAISLREKLNNIPTEIESFQAFLAFVGVTREQYILAIRSVLTRPKVMQKRLPKDVYVNPFSKKIIELFKANMDIQYILDPFACSQYIVNYINKGDRHMSRLLRAVVEEAEHGNKNVQESLRSISNMFLNAS
ncbi:unnamed protein product [Hermetia illucens]|uniref:Uncharacterized protein n=1 Tax=Hermetia illucens TaxID=343691 RepID=A0A7R8UCS9_HERIL|nr:unnamed protein product [Hermetia illucens]